jgi:hypothetical protein
MGAMVSSTIDKHPDLVGMRLRYEAAAEAPIAQVVEGFGLITGLYLALSPWILGFTDLPALTMNNLITGIAVALLTAGFASAFGRTHGFTWVAPIIGAWTVVAPWVVSGNADSTTTITSNAIAGGLCVVLGLAAMAVGLRNARR